jgi:hypothetical protein
MLCRLLLMVGCKVAPIRAVMMLLVLIKTELLSYPEFYI